MTPVSCRYCGSKVESGSICGDCRKWKEFRRKSNLCACDVCYETEQYQKAVMVLVK